MRRWHVELGPYRFTITADDRQGAEQELTDRLEAMRIDHPGPATWHELDAEAA